MFLHFRPDDLISGVHQFVFHCESFSQYPDVGRDPSLREHIPVLPLGPVFPDLIVHQVQAGGDPLIGIGGKPSALQEPLQSIRIRVDQCHGIGVLVIVEHALVDII